jgi:hypothetical protein
MYNAGLPYGDDEAVAVMIVGTTSVVERYDSDAYDDS